MVRRAGSAQTLRAPLPPADGHRITPAAVRAAAPLTLRCARSPARRQRSNNWVAQGQLYSRDGTQRTAAGAGHLIGISDSDRR